MVAGQQSTQSRGGGYGSDDTVAVMLGLDDLVAQSVADYFGNGVTVQSAHEIGAMSLRGLDRDLQQRSNFFSAKTFC
jgi:hypothetical protein